MYYITNYTTNEEYNVMFSSITEARHWVINHLDLSHEIVIEKEQLRSAV